MLSKRPALHTLARAFGAVRQNRSCPSGEISHTRRGISRDSIVLVVEREPLLRWANYETLTGAGVRVQAGCPHARAAGQMASGL